MDHRISRPGGGRHQSGGQGDDWCPGGAISWETRGVSKRCGKAMVMKNLQPQTGPGQNIYFFIFFIILVIIAFIIFLSFILSSSFFYHFFIIFYHFLNHFLSFFIIFFIIFLKSFFIIFASSGAKIFQEMENYNFPRVFFIFLSFFFSFFHFFHHFSSFFIILHQFHHWKQKW